MSLSFCWFWAEYEGANVLSRINFVALKHSEFALLLGDLGKDISKADFLLISLQSAAPIFCSASHQSKEQRTLKKERIMPLGSHSKRVRFACTLVSGIIALFTSGCFEPQEEARVIVENDLEILAGRIDYKSEVVEIDSVESVQKTLGKALADTITLTLVAEVTPPDYNGQVLQATGVIIKSQNAYVSYNMRGEPFLGGVDVFDIADITTPQLISSAVFIDTDVNGLAEQGNTLYLAAATERPEFDSPAVLELISLSGGLLTEETSTIDLPSYACTDVEVAGNFVYVTSGADGGYVTVFKASTMEEEYALPVEDARGVSSDNTDVGVVAGTPARLLTFDRDSGALVNDYTLGGAAIPFSKSTIEINRSKAILGLGDGGTQIVCLATGDTIVTVPQPIVPGLDASVTVTNAATTDNKTLFMANGEAGVYVAMAATRFDSKDCAVDDLEIIGKFRFDDFQSVNHVTYRNGVLFIAGGLGGLKILTVSE